MFLSTQVATSHFYLEVTKDLLDAAWQRSVDDGCDLYLHSMSVLCLFIWVHVQEGFHACWMPVRRGECILRKLGQVHILAVRLLRAVYMLPGWSVFDFIYGFSNAESNFLHLAAVEYSVLSHCCLPSAPNTMSLWLFMGKYSFNCLYPGLCHFSFSCKMSLLQASSSAYVAMHRGRETQPGSLYFIGMLSWGSWCTTFRALAWLWLQA